MLQFRRYLLESALTGFRFAADHAGHMTTSVVYHGDEVVGSLEIGPDGMGARAAMRLFPDVTTPQDKIYRVYGIEVEEAYRGRGLGKMLYLFGYSQFPGGKFYNSQAWDDAVRTLNSLAGNGLIELHWRSTGGAHISWLTPAGLAQARTLPT